MEPCGKFKDKFNIDPNGCWIWNKFKLKSGYGTTAQNKKTYLAHRLSYLLHVGMIPKGLWVLHKCDNPSCVNPDHLFLGTHQDNTDDKVSKGRQLRGDSHNMSKLTEDEITAIREFPKFRGAGVILAKRYDVTPSMISYIRNGKSWKHLQ